MQCERDQAFSLILLTNKVYFSLLFEVDIDKNSRLCKIVVEATVERV